MPPLKEKFAHLVDQVTATPVGPNPCEPVTWDSKAYEEANAARNDFDANRKLYLGGEVFSDEKLLKYFIFEEFREHGIPIAIRR